jgi:hypothetical protein
LSFVYKERGERGERERESVWAEDKRKKKHTFGAEFY